MLDDHHNHQFVIRNNIYYDDLLRDLDDRNVSQYNAEIQLHPFVPTLSLRRSGVSPRISFGSNSSGRPESSRPSTGRPHSLRSSSDQTIEREMRRADKLYTREISQALKARGRLDSNLSKLLNDNKLRGKEL